MWSLAYPGEAKGQGYLTLRDVPKRERERWEGVFLGFLRLVTFRHHGKPLILKSPPHTARMTVLARMFPNARFLHIVRDPYVVFASTLQDTVRALSSWQPSFDAGWLSTPHRLSAPVPAAELA